MNMLLPNYHLELNLTVYTDLSLSLSKPLDWLSHSRQDQSRMRATQLGHYPLAHDSTHQTQISLGQQKREMLFRYHSHNAITHFLSQSVVGRK